MNADVSRRVEREADIGHPDCGSLQPRFYSISSSPRAHKQEVHVTAALVEYEKPGQEKGRVYEGMVTGT